MPSSRLTVNKITCYLDFIFSDGYARRRHRLFLPDLTKPHSSQLKFRSRKKALDLCERIAARLTQLQGTQFVWSTTTANPGSQNLSSDAFKYEEGVLRHYGYKVGMNGLSESERWEILDTVFLRPLLLDFGQKEDSSRV